MKLFKIRAWFVADGPVEKADGVMYVKVKDGRDVVDLAIEEFKKSPFFRDMKFQRCSYQEIRSKRILKEYGIS